MTCRQPRGRLLAHVSGLDGLRGIAILMVMSTHLLFVLRAEPRVQCVRGGFLGVELFFVFSGFLITSLLIVEQGRSGRISLRGFYTVRALRLLPAVVVLLAVHLIYAAITGLALGVEIRSVLEGLFYASNWFLVTGHPFAAGLQHLWSLSVEEQFYVVWPILTAGMLAWRWSRTYAVVIIVAVIGALTVHTYMLWRPGTNFLQINVVYARTDVQAVCLLAGAAAAYVWSRHALPLGILSVLATVSVVFIAVCTWYLDVTAGFYYRGGLTLIGIAGRGRRARGRRGRVGGADTCSRGVRCSTPWAACRTGCTSGTSRCSSKCTGTVRRCRLQRRSASRVADDGVHRRVVAVRRDAVSPAQAGALG